MTKQGKFFISTLIICTAIACSCGQGVISSAKKQHREFVGNAPNKSDVVGTYILTDQSIIKGGISALQGRQCQLDIMSDGTFNIRNYPDWRAVPSVAGTEFNSFTSTTGHWELSIVGSSYGYGADRKDIWGLRFSESRNKIDPTALTGLKPHYGLLTILGDPDSNNNMRFKRMR